VLHKQYACKSGGTLTIHFGLHLPWLHLHNYVAVPQSFMPAFSNADNIFPCRDSAPHFHGGLSVLFFGSRAFTEHDKPKAMTAAIAC